MQHKVKEPHFVFWQENLNLLLARACEQGLLIIANPHAHTESRRYGYRPQGEAREACSTGAAEAYDHGESGESSILSTPCAGALMC